MAFNFDDPMTQAGLMMAAGLLSPQDRRLGKYGQFFGALGQGIQGGLLGFNEAQQSQRRNALTDAQLARSNIELQALKDANDYKGRADALYANHFQLPQKQIDWNDTLGTGPEAPIQQAAPGKSDLSGYMNALPGLGRQGLSDALTLQEKIKKEQPEVKEVRTVMNNGQPSDLVIFKDGTSKILPYGTATKLEQIDTGGAKGFVSPYTGALTGPTYIKTQSPDSKASLSQSERHFQQTQSNPQLAEGPNGPVWVTKPSGMTPGATVETGIGPKMSDKQKGELQNIDAQAAVVERAIKTAEATPNAFGFKRGMATLAGTMPEALASRNDTDEERQARSLVFNIVSKVINERAGAAQSKQELARLRSFLPGELDRADQIVSKFNAFKTYLDEQRGVYAAPVGKPPMSTNSSPSLADIEAEILRRRGGR